MSYVLTFVKRILQVFGATCIKIILIYVSDAMPNAPFLKSNLIVCLNSVSY